jgi:hypothetical protein
MSQTKKQVKNGQNISKPSTDLPPMDTHNQLFATEPNPNSPIKNRDMNSCVINGRSQWVGNKVFLNRGANNGR